MTSSQASSTGTASDASTTGTGTGKETGTATETGTASGTASGTDTKTKDHSTKTTSISIDPAAGAGGISMITPASTTTTYYKIGHNVTFVWNYTSLSVTPSAIDVVASCSLNSATYTLTSNMSVKETGSLVWDTGKYQANPTIPLLTATYTLFVVDSEKSLDDTPEAGYLSSNVGFPFGMYIGSKPTPLNEFLCVTCSSAMSEFQRTGLTFAAGMALITVLSFTWFAGTFGLFSL
ncbi:hypothetical protein N7468_006646 [Penicillium chermesinum]|uniref:DUF7137 domain-containing protein n=1 Tax=Penicillium chermesinum TaxID=63820 RepID=A0A9W9NSL8_9EURO|nr:uncharacterized protein N7468_006646 [Penicillium chermesinum]KAJ5225421.1 hypothetical protein N7468_006646 [Penicillium chermesinum]